MEQEKVFVHRIDSYKYPLLKEKLYCLIEGFLENKNIKNQRVILKPNLLTVASVESAILTHPLVVKAVAEYFIDKGAKVQLSDSPATGSFERILKKGGYIDALKGLNIKLTEFKSSKTIDIGPPFGKIEIATDALEADILVNIPKLKTHTQMLLTLAVKNLFGTVVGIRKPQWHFRTGIDRLLFATLLVRIAKVLNPSINIMDAIVGLHGQGPGKRGSPKPIGALFASSNPFALDMAVCTLVGLPPEKLLTVKVALQEGLIEKHPIIEGDSVTITDFSLPETTSLVFGPSFMKGFLRKHLTQRPVVQNDLCNQCQSCIKICPACAIKLSESAVRFNYDICIRCYCCVEVCPQGALYAHEPVLSKMMKKIFSNKL